MSALNHQHLQSSEIFVETLNEYRHLPAKSKKKYVGAYDNFIAWKNAEDIKSISEHVFLAYFEEMGRKYKPSTLWSVYSMLKATVKEKNDIDLKDYTSLMEYLKSISRGFASKKAKELSAEQIQTFLDQAPDECYLVTKVVLIFSITGACRSYELVRITTKDIEDRGDMFLVRISNDDNKTLRTFTIHGQFYKIVKKYKELRTPLAKHDRFFQNFQKGKCTCQPIGKNKMATMAFEIARYLKLPGPAAYTGHSLRRTSFALQADDRGANLFYDDFQEAGTYAESLDEYNHLPEKSKEKYVSVYDNFIYWKNSENIKPFSEHVLLAYFEELAKRYKPSTLWCFYSMLKTTIKAKNNVELKNYVNLHGYLRNLSKEIKTNKVKVLSAEHIQKFLDEAPDIPYLVTKVVLIFAITGACNRKELSEITTKDIEQHGEMFLVRITNKKNKTLRTFTIHGQFFKIVKKYELLRTPTKKHDRFFLNYQKGKCTKQPIGINKFGSMTKEIATYLELPNPGSYTSRSLRRTSFALLSDDKGAQLLYDD